jgi:RNA polymerase sigma-70 factor, ECF subfamily
MVGPTDVTTLAAARAGDTEAFARLTEPHRRELLTHCYRMLGSLQDAEDLVQETLLRAWQQRARFEGRSSPRAWLYAIATNACLDSLRARRRRSLPHASGQPGDPSRPFEQPTAERVWLEPFPDHLLGAATASAEAATLAREQVSLAFLTALHVLPPRQRAVLLMRDALSFSAAEAAVALDLTVPAVNSLLHRARVALARHRACQGATPPAHADAPADRSLLDRYVHVWLTADVPGLVALLRHDATLAMPPSPTWFRGPAAIGAFAAATVFAIHAAPQPGGAAVGRWRLLPTSANGQPAFGVYQRDDAVGDRYLPSAISLLAVADGQIAEILSFLLPGLFPLFGLPAALDGRAAVHPDSG